MDATEEQVSRENESKVQLLLHLRHRGIADLSVLRAVEVVQRETFIPHRYRDLAHRNLALPIACGQMIPEPYLTARMMVALSLSPTHHVLEVGAGSGYSTAILSKLSGTVIAIERFRGLAAAAWLRLEKCGVRNVTIRVEDAFALTADIGTFDRMIVHGRMEGVLDRLLSLLRPEGILVGALRTGHEANGLASLVKIHKTPGEDIESQNLGLCRLRPLIPGISNYL